MEQVSETRIAVDGWYLGEVHRHTGIYVYTRELLRELRNITSQYLVEITPFLHNPNSFAATPGFRPARALLLGSDRVWRYGGAALTALLHRPDVLFSPSVNSLYWPVPVPVVTTIHDLAPELMPNFAPPAILRKLRFFLGRAVKSSAHLIAISESCKRDLMRVYQVPESKISVVYSGCDNTVFNASVAAPEQLAALQSKCGLWRPYIFHHGMMQPRKNLKRLMEAWAQVLARRPELELDLVLAGKLGWQGEELMATARALSGDQGRVVFPGPMSELDLAILLKGALMAAVPSLYEGFCLPMVEAMACGVPVIAAKGSCLPEVSGGVLRYFDPERVNEMAMCLETAVTSEPLRRELAATGLKQAQRFSWRRTADETLKVLLGQGC